MRGFPLLERLRVDVDSRNGYVDFNHFSHHKSITSLVVVGDEMSDIDFKNLEGLASLKNLKHLTLYDFGTVDLHPLRKVPWLKGLFCAYANTVYDVEAISTLTNLKALDLTSSTVDNLDFLDGFPDSLLLELSGIKVRDGINHDKLKRFEKDDFFEIEEWW